jgi:hydroxymethylpyrimidine pyrophosphatase-like HAD family hydrolase
MIRKYRKPVPELKAFLREQGRGVQKVQCFFRDEALRRRTWAELERRFPETAVTTSIVNNLEINARDSTKGRALARLAAHLGLDLSETMAFGDDSNDISMLRTAGIGVAMGNASADARAAADEITLSNDENGVAAALNRLFTRISHETT